MVVASRSAERPKREAWLSVVLATSSVESSELMARIKREITFKIPDCSVVASTSATVAFSSRGVSVVSAAIVVCSDPASRRCISEAAVVSANSAAAVVSANSAATVVSANCSSRSSAVVASISAASVGAAVASMFSSPRTSAVVASISAASVGATVASMSSRISAVVASISSRISELSP